MDRPHDSPAVVVRCNPFATRYVASARLVPRDDQGGQIDLPSLARRLAGLGGTAAIVGPHGTGKSTLLAHVAGILEAGGRPVRRTRATRRGDVAGLCGALLRLPRGGTLCVDSFEVLGTAGRQVLLGMARCRGVALLVTSHRSSSLPTLVTTRGTSPLLAALTGELPGHESWFGRFVFPEDINAAFSDSAGDLRMAFDRLYDLFEQRTSASVPPSAGPPEPCHERPLADRCR